MQQILDECVCSFRVSGKYFYFNYVCIEIHGSKVRFAASELVCTIIVCICPQNRYPI